MPSFSVDNRYTIHYEPLAGGTTKTHCMKLIAIDCDAKIFEPLCSKSIHTSRLRYDPNGRSEILNSKKNSNDYIAPIKVNGFIEWHSPYEIHIRSGGWYGSSALGHVTPSIPGIQGVNSVGSSPIEIKIEFKNHEPILTKHTNKNNKTSIYVKKHPHITTVDEIVFDELEWFHNAYPFQTSQCVGVRIQMDTDKLVYDSFNSVDEFDFQVPYYSVERRYGDEPSKKDYFS